jgi:hypothetical protein
MARRKTRSISEELRARSARGKLFTPDGRKLRDIGRVGAMAPDTDPPDTGPPAHPASHRPPPRADR